MQPPGRVIACFVTGARDSVRQLPFWLSRSIVRCLQLRNIATVASVLLNPAGNQKMRQKSQWKYDERCQWAKRDRDQQFGQPKYPDKTFASECLRPVRLTISSSNARCERRPETRHRLAIRPIRFRLSFQQGFFLARNQPINKNPICQHQENKS